MEQERNYIHEDEVRRLREANENQLIFHKTQMKIVVDELQALKADYQTLREATLVLGKPFAIINHLEKQIRIRDHAINCYQEHYAKWGTFYKDYEDKHDRKSAQ